MSTAWFLSNSAKADLLAQGIQGFRRVPWGTVVTLLSTGFGLSESRDQEV